MSERPRFARVTTVRTFHELAAEIRAAAARLGDVRLVTVDGPSGSGKTIFAQRLVTALSTRGSVALVQIEELYAGWTLDGAWERLHNSVLEPLAAGCPGGFHPYDWATNAWSPSWRAVPLSHVLVVEGCGSSPRAADPLTSRRIWIEAPSEVSLARGTARGGVDLDRHLETWQRLEADYFVEQDTRHRADLQVDGNPGEPLAYDDELAFSAVE